MIAKLAISSSSSVLGCSGGHYTAYALNDVNKCWYEYDDQIVSQVPASQIQKAEVYVLFYRCFRHLITTVLILP